MRSRDTLGPDPSGPTVSGSTDVGTGYTRHAVRIGAAQVGRKLSGMSSFRPIRYHTIERSGGVGSRSCKLGEPPHEVLPGGVNNHMND